MPGILGERGALSPSTRRLPCRDRRCCARRCDRRARERSWRPECRADRRSHRGPRRCWRCARAWWDAEVRTERRAYILLESAARRRCSICAAFTRLCVIVIVFGVEDEHLCLFVRIERLLTLELVIRARRPWPRKHRAPRLRAWRHAASVALLASACAIANGTRNSIARLRKRWRCPLLRNVASTIAVNPPIRIERASSRKRS